MLPRSFRWALLAALAVSFCSCASSSATTGDVLRCTKLELVNSSGEVIAVLTSDDDGNPYLRMYGGGGHASLMAAADHAGLSAGGGAGVAFLGVTNRDAGFNARGANLRNGIWAGVRNQGNAGLRSYGESLKGGVRLEVEEDGAPVLRLADPAGQTVLRLPAD